MLFVKKLIIIYDVSSNVFPQLAKRENRPIFVVFNNKQLQAIADKKPKTLDEFKKIDGVGDYKAKRYGKPILKTVKDWEAVKDKPLVNPFSPHVSIFAYVIVICNYLTVSL